MNGEWTGEEHLQKPRPQRIHGEKSGGDNIVKKRWPDWNPLRQQGEREKGDETRYRITFLGGEKLEGTDDVLAN